MLNTKKYQIFARNYALTKIKGSYLSFLDDDDAYPPNRLEVYINYMKSHPDIQIAYSPLEFIDEFD